MQMLFRYSVLHAFAIDINDLATKVTYFSYKYERQVLVLVHFVKLLISSKKMITFSYKYEKVDSISGNFTLSSASLAPVPHCVARCRRCDSAQSPNH